MYLQQQIIVFTVKGIWALVGCSYTSVKNVYLSIKYEGIKLKQFLIASKEGVNVVVWFQFRNGLTWKLNIPRTIENTKKVSPIEHLQNVQNISYKWLKTNNF